MIQDGDRGAILQRDKQTYAVAPHLPCGVVTPAMLRKIADVAEKYGAQALKCTSAQRIAIVGVKEEDVDRIWQEFGEAGRPGHLFGDCVRSVKACPGTQFCKRARQDSLAVGMELDRLYHGKRMPGKMKIGVSGCPNQCSETPIKDIGLVGSRNGWMIYVGGSGGSCARLADLLSVREFTTEEAYEIVEKIVGYYQQKARHGERIGELIDRLGGIGKMKNAIGVR
jgi:NAD(P)H-nitrite reductase large subunit